MRQDVKEMEREVDLLWFRLAYGYSGFVVTAYATASVAMWLEYLDWSLIPMSMALGAPWLLPWFISTLRVSRAIRSVNARTRQLRMDRLNAE